MLGEHQQYPWLIVIFYHQLIQAQLHLNWDFYQSSPLKFIYFPHSVNHQPPLTFQNTQQYYQPFICYARPLNYCLIKHQPIQLKLNSTFLTQDQKDPMASIDGQKPIHYKKYILKHFPDEHFPKDLSCFETVNATYNPDDVKDKMIAIRVRYITIDPMLRVWISGAKTYLPALVPGSNIPGFGVGQVIKINDSSNRMNKPQVGEYVFGTLEWSEIMICSIKQAQKIPVQIEEMYKFLTVYGPSGLTSYLAIREEILPLKILKGPGSSDYKQRPQVKILISSAAGGIGTHLIEYLVKLGYRQIYGIAGGKQKCDFVKKLGAKDCIDYKKYLVGEDYQSFANHIKQMMNGNADIYFDNIGEQMLTTALICLKRQGKVILCGATATYNNWKSKGGILNSEMIISKSIECKGILYYQYSEGKKVMAVLQMIDLDIKGTEVLIQGMENLPLACRDVFNGKYMGKPIVEFTGFK